MTSAFISYTHRDYQVAMEIKNLLSDRGVDVFIDEIGLRPGPFWSQLGSEIRSRDFFIVLLSPDAAKSKWVPKEIAWAFKTKVEDTIIPILVAPLSDDDWEQVFGLVAFQYIDLTKWPEPDNVGKSIAKLLQNMKLPSGLPVTVPYRGAFEEVEEREGEEEEEEEGPWIPLADIRQLLDAAQLVQDQNHPRALFLFRQALSSLQDYVNRYERLGTG